MMAAAIIQCQSGDIMRRMLIIISLIGVVPFGCSKRPADDEIPPNVRDVIEVARQQSAAFSNGTCTIRQAFRYTGPLPFARRGANAFLGLIVDVSGYGPHFDFDDIDLIDADTSENLGSNPGLWPLKPDGMAEVDFKELTATPGTAAVILLYERETIPKRIKLGYWGMEIVKEAVEVSAEGRDMFTAK